MNILGFFLVLALPAVLEQQLSGQDLDAIFAKGEKLLEEAKASYEEGRTRSALDAYVQAGFKLEEARIKFLVLQEVATGEKQKTAADRLRSIQQFHKLINDGRIALANPAAPEPAAPAKAVPDPAAGANPATPAVEALPSGKLAPRLPIPLPAALKEAETTIKELFKEAYGKKGSSDRQALARELLAQGGRNAGDPAGTYVLYREAADVAILGGSVPLALSAVEELCKGFDVDGLGLRASTLGALGKTVRNPAENGTLANAWMQLSEEYIAADLYDGAEKAAAAALVQAKNSGNVVLAQRAVSRSRDIAESKVLFQAVKGSLQTLASAPEDPAANDVMGQFLCFVKGSWDLGLRFLAKGSNPALKALAEQELAALPPCAEGVKLADDWYALLEKEKGPLRRAHLLVHCRDLYEKHGPHASGMTAVRVEKRLGELGRSGTGAVDLLALIDPVADSIQGAFSREGKSLVLPKANFWDRLEIPYVPPEEYDLTAVVERKEGSSAFMLGLVSGGKQFVLTLDGWTDGDINGLEYINGKRYPENETQFKGRFLALGKPATVVCLIRRGGVTVSLDGRRLVDWKGSPASLSPHPLMPTRNPGTFLLSAWDSSFRIHQMTLLPVSGQGKKLR